MSFDIRSIREVPNDPFAKFATKLSKELSKFLNKNQTDKLENKEDIYSNGQDVESVLKLHSYNSTNRFDFLKLYYSAAEPDNDFSCRLWLRGSGMGNTLQDISGNDRSGVLYGDPVLIDGDPFDYGIHTGDVRSRALRFNRPTSASENDEYISVPYDWRHRAMQDISTGISFFIRFRHFSDASQGGSDRRLYEKWDDAGNGSEPDDGIQVVIASDGDKKLNITTKRAGVKTAKFTPINSILPNGTVYDVWITYKQSDGTIKCYINGVDQTLTAGTTGYGWHGDENNWDWSIMGSGDDDNRHVYGDFYDFEVIRERILTYDSHGNSVFINGTTDIVDCGNQASLWSQALSKFSWSVWVYPTEISSTIFEIIRHGSGGGGRFRVDYDTSPNNKVRYYIRNNANTLDFTASTPVSNLNLNQWNHIVGTYDNSLGSANIKIYVNKVVGGTTGNLTDAINTSANLTIGGGSSPAKGYFRDFRWWTTKALTQSEINSVYDDSIYAPAADYRQRLTEGSGSPKDFVNGVLTATLSGGTSWITSEITNHYTNKWTTSYIPFGQVMVSNYWATHYLSPSLKSFTTASFTTASFTAG